MTSETVAAKEKLTADLRSVVEDTEDLLKATAGQAGDKIAQVRARAEQSLRAAKDRLIEIEEDAVEKVKGAAKATDAYVHENPWKAIGIAAGVGFVLGMLVSRRS
jgi:ElaB/YqjD/DUF883 family membrane-anchored ribosome-binding protein